MENKLNIAEILKDCPKGTKLYSPLCGECELSEIDGNTIRIFDSNANYYLYHDGSYVKTGECLLFPSKENRDWGKFKKPFEDGDIVTCTNNTCTYTAIFKEMIDNSSFCHYGVLVDNRFRCRVNDWSDFNETCRFATYDEKEKLFKAIKDNGYVWNPKTKTMEKLPKFKVGDRIKKKGIDDAYAVEIATIIQSIYTFTNFNWQSVESVDRDYELVTDIKPKFKDGDIVSTANGLWIGIVKRKVGNAYETYTTIDYGATVYNDDTSFCFERFATEEEKQRIFDAIKENGYKWNEETKTLEKLVESNEDVDDRIVMSGIYFNRENYADEVELHFNNYEIEIRDGKTYAVFKNQETKTLEKLPKFKVGDKIKFKENNGRCLIENTEWICTIRRVEDRYYVDGHPLYYTIPFDEQDEYELVAEPKFKIGDRIKSTISSSLYTVVDIKDETYYIKNDGEKYPYPISFSQENLYELVTDKFDITIQTHDVFGYKIDDIVFVKNIGWVKITNKRWDSYLNKYFYKVEGLLIKNEYDNISHDDIETQTLEENKFDVSSLKPFDKLLVRRNQYGTWDIGFYGYYKNGCIYTVCGNIFEEFIPYEGNEHLLSTTNDCDEYFKTW